MIKIISVVLALVGYIHSLETRPNSLPLSVANVNAALEVKVCGKRHLLGADTTSDLVTISLTMDSLLATANAELEELYVKIGVILDQTVNDPHLDKTWKKLILNALQQLITIANGLNDRLQANIGEIDASLSAVIDLVNGALISVNKLECDCACHIHKRGVALILGTATALQKCIEVEESSVHNILEETNARLQEIINEGVRNCIPKLINAEIRLSSGLALIIASQNTCSVKNIEEGIAAGTSLLTDARVCYKNNA